MQMDHQTLMKVSQFTSATVLQMPTYLFNSTAAAIMWVLVLPQQASKP